MYKGTKKTYTSSVSLGLRTLGLRTYGPNAMGTLILLAALLTSSTLSAQSFEKAIPMGDWADFNNIAYSGNPAPVHLRTGYENAIFFPEPIVLYSVNNRLVDNGTAGTIPGCDIEIESNALRFSPLTRFNSQTVSVRGMESGFVYELLVESSPVGSRQPIKITR